MRNTLLLMVICVFTLNGQYLKPPELIEKVFNSKAGRGITAVRNTKLVYEYTYSRTVPLENLAQKKLALAGLEIVPDLFSEPIVYPYDYLAVKNVETGKKHIIYENDPSILSFSTSPNSNMFAVLKSEEDGIFVEIYSLPLAKLLYHSDFKINRVLDYLAMEWHPDGKHLIVNTIPDNYGSIPKRTKTDFAPSVEEATGKKAGVRTYTRLLKTKYDKKLFEHFFTSQIRFIDPYTKKVTLISKPDLIRSYSVSPDANYILIKKILKPFFTTVPYWRFPYKYEIWDKNGNYLETLVQKGVQDQILPGGSELGMRYPEWLANEESTLYWPETQDEGDPKKEVEFRDIVYKRQFPTGKKEIFFKSKNRFWFVKCFKERNKFLVGEYDRDTEVKELYFLSDEQRTPFVTINVEDKYNDPGEILTIKELNNYDYIAQNKDEIFLRGLGDSPQGRFPFLNTYNLKTKLTKNIFRCKDKHYERMYSFYNGDYSKIYIRSESKLKPRNYFIVNLEKNERKAVSDNTDPAPELRSLKKEIITYQREDSVLLSGKLYYPLNYQPGKKYPLFIWAYPQEYTDPAVAAQVTGSEYTFTNFWAASPVYLALHGYMVLDDASMPVIGDVEKRNNTFANQITMNAEAAVNYLAEKGLVDPERVGVGGHSYGAFMTANLLIHTKLFKAGIARSGAYNRTLTPFGFQSEDRNYWEAKQFYNFVSPFQNADKLNSPILLIHGSEDTNPGTYPIQSQRFYAAAKGLGKTTRLVMLPYEDHGYHAKESQLHVLAEMCNWLDRFLKK